jgi:DNA polymerase III subunit beta
MQVTILQSDLTKGLSYTAKAVSSRGQLPVLANVLLEASEQGLVISATNLEQGIRVEVGGKVDKPGSITVPARNFAELVSSVAGSQITLSADNEKLTIKSDKIKAVLAGIAASEFPVLPKVTSDKSSRLTTSLIGEVASQVAYAAAVDESRPVLTGVQFVTKESQLIATATDGFRLSRKRLVSEGTQLSSVILPAKTVLELARIAADSGETEIGMQVVSENNQVIFVCGAIQLISRVLEGNFPDTEKRIPTEFRTEVTVDRQEFTKALRTMAIFARDSNNIIKFKVEGSQIKIMASSSASGGGEAEVEAEITGEGGEIAFNYKYLLDFLGGNTAERIVMKINDNLSPGVFVPEQDTSLTHLIMPVRI